MSAVGSFPPAKERQTEENAENTHSIRCMATERTFSDCFYFGDYTRYIRSFRAYLVKVYTSTLFRKSPQNWLKFVTFASVWLLVNYAPIKISLHFIWDNNASELCWYFIFCNMHERYVAETEVATYGAEQHPISVVCIMLLCYWLINLLLYFALKCL